MLTLLLIFFLSLFGTTCPLYLWLIDGHKEKIKLHRFILGLSLASSVVTTLFYYSLNISNSSKIVIYIWVFLLSVVTLYYWRKSSYSNVLISIPSIAGMLLIYSLISEIISPSILSFLIILVGAFILSGSMFAMILGHWYLNVVNIPISLLRNTTKVLMFFIIFRLVWNIILILNESIVYNGYFLSILEFIGTIDGVFLCIAILFGTILPLFLSYLTLRTIYIHSTQSATGLLYVMVISVIMGDLFFKYYIIRYGLVI
tara:strand:- start:18271 stop:19044 length:774 start_codon:yes stop_codon:yes gene_type:complete